MKASLNIPSPEQIREKLSPLFAEADIHLVVLFGSASKGQMNRRSDIDLAFLYDGPIDRVQMTNTISRLLRTDAVDIIDLRTAGPLLKFAALRDGKLLYERSPGLFLSAYSLAFRRYVDTKKLRDGQRSAIRSYLAGHMRS